MMNKYELLERVKLEVDYEVLLDTIIGNLNDDTAERILPDILENLEDDDENSDN